MLLRTYDARHSSRRLSLIVNSYIAHFTSLLFCFFPVVLPLAAQPRCAPVPPNLSAWFTFDEPEFRSLRVPGRVGSAARFNGKDQFKEIPASTPGVAVGEDDFTIELWLRTSDSVNTPSLVDKRDYAPLGYLLFTYKGHPGFQVSDGGKDHNVIAMSLNVADGRWHHVAGVVRRLPPEPLRIYVDGVKDPKGSAYAAPLVNIDVPTPLWLGRHHANKLMQTNEIYYRGDMDELTFYHRALTAPEIQSIFRAGSAGKCH
jgi:hypothetical protein